MSHDHYGCEALRLSRESEALRLISDHRRSGTLHAEVPLVIEPLRRLGAAQVVTEQVLDQTTAARVDAGPVGGCGRGEPVPHVLKNEVAAAAQLSGTFAVNAAWFRLTLLTDNLLRAWKRLALPGE